VRHVRSLHLRTVPAKLVVPDDARQGNRIQNLELSKINLGAREPRGVLKLCEAGDSPDPGLLAVLKHEAVQDNPLSKGT
jgi:hypothetical protein